MTRVRYCPGGTYRNLTDCEGFVLVLACAPLDGGDEALPHALNEFSIRECLFLLLSLDRVDNLSKCKLGSRDRTR